MLHDQILDPVGENPHPHACIIFDEMTSYRAVASGYIIHGLKQNEKCILATDAYTPQMIREDFAKAGMEIEPLIAKGALSLIDIKTSYADNGGFEPDKTVTIWKQTTQDALKEGFHAVRVVGEATFALGNPDLKDKLIYYENIINQKLFPHYPFKALCVYDKSLYPPEIIKAVINAHPIFYYNEQLFLENIHYVPPEVHFESKIHGEVEIWLKNVKRNNENLLALKENEAKFRTMFEKAPVSYQSLDEDGNFIEVNETWLQILGYEKEEVIGHNFSEFLHPDWKEHFKENFPRFKTVGEILGVEFQMVKKDGSLILVSFHGKVAKDHNGDFGRTHCIFNDITEIRRSEKRQEEYTRNLETIFNSTPNILMLVDRDARVTDINKKGLQVLNRSKDELQGLLCGDVIQCVNCQDDLTCGETLPVCKQCPLRRIIASTFNTGHPHDDEEMTMALISDGQTIERHFLISSALLTLSDSDNVLISMMDITERKRLEAHIRETQRMESIGNLAGGIAHDFNNLLFPIIGMAEMLCEDLPPNSPAHDNVQEILKAGQRGSGLVKQILSFSRQQNGTQKTPVQLQHLVEEVIKLSRHTIPADIEITHTLQPDCDPILADPTQIHQIGINLITNAYHAMDKTPGKIDIQVKQITLDPESLTDTFKTPGSYALFTVSDNGMGMEPETVEKIFDPYFTTKEMGKGTGLGLAVVYGIVREHDGMIRVYSEKGDGSTFQIYFPIIASSDRPYHDKAATTPGTIHNTQHRSSNILLIDDDAAILNLEKMMLERMGYHVDEFLNPLNALQAFNEAPHAFDLIISDMTMPAMTGDKLTQKLLAIRRDIPIIICTGFSERMNEEIAAKLGIAGLLMKPVSRLEMGNLVQSVLAKNP